MSTPQMVLQVPLNISGNKVTVAGTPVFGPPGSTAKALSNSKDRLAQLKQQLKLAQIEYKKAPSAINLKKVEMLTEQIRAMMKTIAKQAKGAFAEYKMKLKALRRKIKDTRGRLRAAIGKAKKQIQIRLDSLINKYSAMQIEHVQALLDKNRSNLAAMRRARLRLRDKLKAMKARIARQTIGDPALKVQMSKLNMRLKKVHMDITAGLRRQKKIINWLNKLKARKNAYNSRRMLQKAAAGAMGSIPQALKSIKDMLQRHEKILRKLSGGRRSKTGGRRKRCGNMALARRRLKRAVRIIVNLKKQPPTPVRDKKISKWRAVAAKRRAALRRIIKCKGLILCGNLKKAQRNLAKARAKLAQAHKTAEERPSDEDAQTARKKYRGRVEFHKKMIKNIWNCVCRRAVKKYKMYKNLYDKNNKPVYLQRMKIHKDMIRRCNCRKARINFNNAKRRFTKNQQQYAQSPQDTGAKDKLTFFYGRMVVHRNKMQSLGCKVPELPPSPLANKGKVMVKRRR